MPPLTDTDPFEWTASSTALDGDLPTLEDDTDGSLDALREAASMVTGTSPSVTTTSVTASIPSPPAVSPMVPPAIET